MRKKEDWKRKEVLEKADEALDKKKSNLDKMQRQRKIFSKYHWYGTLLQYKT